MALENDVLEAG